MCLDCFELGPPPDNILSMPPPPLPSFLLQRNTLSLNETQPCIPDFMCNQSSGTHDKFGSGTSGGGGIEFIELTNKGIDDTWILVLISSCIGVFFLAAVLAMLLFKCKDTYNYHYSDSAIKQQAPSGDPAKSKNKPSTNKHPILSGTMLYPCSTNNQIFQQQITDNRMLWAALTPHGTTRHYVAEPIQMSDNHYEVIDYESKHRDIAMMDKRVPIKSFDNNGFTDYEYEDPSPLIDSQNGGDDFDSGYQEPHDTVAIPTGTLGRGPIQSKPLKVSSPTRINNPNLPPLNMYPYITTAQNYRNYGGTLTKKSMSRRSSGTSTIGWMNN